MAETLKEYLVKVGFSVDSGGYNDAMQKINSLRESLQSLSEGNAVSLDSSGAVAAAHEVEEAIRSAQGAISELQASLSSVASESPFQSIIDSAEIAKSYVSDLASTIDGIEDKDVTVSVDADTANAQSEIDSLQNTKDVEVNVDADTADAQSAIDSLPSTVEIDAVVESSEAESKLVNLAEAREAKINVVAANTNAASAAIDAVASKKRTATIDVVFNETGTGTGYTISTSGRIPKSTKYSIGPDGMVYLGTEYYESNQAGGTGGGTGGGSSGGSLGAKEITDLERKFSEIFNKFIKDLGEELLEFTGESITAYSNRSKSEAILRATLVDVESEEERARIANEIIAVSEKATAGTAHTGTEGIDFATILLQGGIKQDTINKNLPYFIKTMDAADVSPERMAEHIVYVSNALGVTDFEKYFDMLFYAATTMAGSPADFMYALERMGATPAAFGGEDLYQSIADYLVLSGAFLQSGSTKYKAGITSRNMAIKWGTMDKIEIKDSDEKTVGTINTYDEKGYFKSILQITEEMKNIFESQGLSQLEVTKAIQEFVKLTDIPGMSALLDGNIESYDDLSKALEEVSQGAALQYWEEMTKSQDYSIAEMQAALVELKTAVGETISPAVVKLADFATEALGSLSQHVQADGSVLGGLMSWFLSGFEPPTLTAEEREENLATLVAETESSEFAAIASSKMTSSGTDAFWKDFASAITRDDQLSVILNYFPEYATEDVLSRFLKDNPNISQWISDSRFLSGESDNSFDTRWIERDEPKTSNAEIGGHSYTMTTYYDVISEEAEEAGEKSVDALAEKAPEMEAAGKKVGEAGGQGMADGMEGKKDEVFSATQTAVQGAEDAAAGLPPRMYAYGYEAMSQYANGIVAGTSLISDAVNQTFANVQSAIATTKNNKPDYSGMRLPQAFGEGGYVDNATYAVVGEKGVREYIIPAENTPRSRSLVSAMFSDMGVPSYSSMFSGFGGRETVNNTRVEAPVTMNVYGNDATTTAYAVNRLLERRLHHNMRGRIRV